MTWARSQVPAAAALSALGLWPSGGTPGASCAGATPLGRVVAGRSQLQFHSEHSKAAASYSWGTRKLSEAAISGVEAEGALAMGMARRAKLGLGVFYCLFSKPDFETALLAII